MQKIIMMFLLFSLGMTMTMAQASFNPNILKSKTETAAKVQKPAVDINHADAKELMSLIGVGEKKAQAIIAYRQEHGLFKSVTELSSVKGFSEKKLASLLKSNEGRVVAKATV